MNTALNVTIGKYVVSYNKNAALSTCLGSCIGLTLHDDFNKIGGLLHIVLPDSQKMMGKQPLTGFADSGIPMMLNYMLSLGADKKRIKAKIAGGATILESIYSVGERNIVKTIEILKKESIPLLSQDIGGNLGRIMRLVISTGTVYVSIIGEKEQELQ